MLVFIFISLCLTIVNGEGLINCLDCFHTFNFNETLINTTGCITVTSQSACMINLLAIQNVTNNEVSLNFLATPDDALLIPMGDSMISMQTSIWLSRMKISRGLQYICFNGDPCGRDYTQQYYTEIRAFNYTNLWSNLSPILYDPSPLMNTSLICNSGQDGNQTEICNGGYCQSVIIFSNNFVLTPLSKCVPNKGQLGIEIVTSNSVSQNQTVIIFTCNKHLCNGQTIFNQIQKILVSASLIPDNTPSTSTITTAPPMTTTSTKRSTGNQLKFTLYSFLLCFIYII